MDYTYYDLEKEKASPHIDLIFPGWAPSDERVVIFSPHDDDAVLGVGLLIQAVLANQGEVYVVIFCQGNAGYTTASQKDTIVETRQKETLNAYDILGVDNTHLIHLDYSDFSVLGYMGWNLPAGMSGTFPLIMQTLRGIKTTRLVIPNAYREHIDHEAVGKIGSYDGPQVGDPILPNWHSPVEIRSFLEYTVWGDFSPEDAVVKGRAPTIRANRALKSSQSSEDTVMKAIQCFKSQQETISHLVEARRTRQINKGVIELYLDLCPRPTIDYLPYCQMINEIEKKRREG